jgi:hypothetical protein
VDATQVNTGPISAMPIKTFGAKVLSNCRTF